MRRNQRAVVVGWLVISTAFASAQPWVEAERAESLRAEDKPGEAARIYGELVKANPADGSAWSQYGYCLHGDKQYDEALKAYARAIELGFQPSSNLYNSACAHALLGHPDEALAWLEKALNARFAEQETLEGDTDMNSLRSDPRFAALTGIIKDLKDKPAATREAGWNWDLDFYARRMKQMHWDLYGKVAPDVFARELDALKQELPKLSDSQVRVRLRRITAMVGDGHTASRLFPEGEPRLALPIHLYAFDDGLFVLGAAKEHADLVGGKVVRIGRLDAEAAMKAVRPYTSVDNDMGYLAAGPSLLASPPILAAIGATADETGAELALKMPDGSERVAKLSPKEFPSGGHGGFLMPDFAYLHDSLSQRPLFLKDVTQMHRMEHLPEHKLVYFWFGAVQDSPHGKLADFCKELFAFIDKHEAEHLVIDMRFNGGGNTGLVRPLITGLMKNERINRKGHLWVLIGRHTFSAAQNTVNLMDKQTEAVFVGEPTGSCPQFVGESTWFMLPHSRTRVSCSSRYWQHMDSTDERTWVQPDIAAGMTFEAYVAGRDPGVEAVLECIVKRATK